MSRTVAQQEAETNKNKELRIEIARFLAMNPPAECNITFELHNNADEEGYPEDYTVTLTATDRKGYYNILRLRLKDVPTIFAYLRGNGACQLYYDGVKEYFDTVLDRVKECLGLCDVTSSRDQTAPVTTDMPSS